MNNSLISDDAIIICTLIICICLLLGFIFNGLIKIDLKNIEEKSPEKKNTDQEKNIFCHEGIKIRFAPGSKDWGVFHVSRPLYASGPNEVRFIFPEEKPRVVNGNSTGIVDEFKISLQELDLIRNKLYKLAFASKVTIHPLKVELEKTAALSWDEVIPEINKVLFDILKEKQTQVV